MHLVLQMQMMGRRPRQRMVYLLLLHLRLRRHHVLLLRVRMVLRVRLVLLLRCSPSAPPLTGSSEIATSHANQRSMFNLLCYAMF